MAGPIRAQFPGGCFIAYNWSIDRPSTGRLVDMISTAHAEGYEQVDLLLSSDGGTLIDAHYLVECILALPIRLVTWNMSAVQSAANMLFALGVERYATPGSIFYFHQTGFAGVAGQRSSEAEITEQLRLIKVGDERAATVLSERTGISAEQITAWQRGSHTLSGHEAVALGFAHDVRRPQIPKNAFVRQVPPNYS